jgi:hypothetical protein
VWALLTFFGRLLRPFTNEMLSEGIAGFARGASYNIIFCSRLFTENRRVASLCEKFVATSKLRPNEAARVIVIGRQCSKHFKGVRKILALAVMLNSAWVYARCRQNGDIHIAICLSHDLMFAPYIAALCNRRLVHRAHGRIDGQLYDGYRGSIIVAQKRDLEYLVSMGHHYDQVILDEKTIAFPWIISPGLNQILWLHGYRKGGAYSFSHLRVDLKKISNIKKIELDSLVVVRPHPSARLLRWTLRLLSATKLLNFKLHAEQHTFGRIYCSSPSMALELAKHQIPYETI